VELDVLPVNAMRCGRRAWVLAVLTACSAVAPMPAAPPAQDLPSSAARTQSAETKASSPAAAPRVASDAKPKPAGLAKSRGARRVPPGSEALASGGPPPPLPEGTTVLHIGDSFAGALGIPLNRELEQHGVHGLLRYRTASYIPTWAFDDEVPRLVRSYRPGLVLITLGANEVEITEPEQRAGQVRRLVHALAGRPCVWISPPLWEQDNGLMRVIRDNCAPCRFMDTNAYIPAMPRVKDGIHPSMEARGVWARVVLDWLARERRPTADEPWALRPGP
jgi:lysophospholipase L1-like esterase